MRIVAIIAAGGRGRRLGAAVPKQLLAIGGRTMLQRSVEAFANHPRVDAMVVVLPPDLVAQPPEYLRRVSKPLQLVAGGDRRQDSVANGLAADESADVVVIHDAARPFVDAQLIDRAIDGAIESGAAICAIQARDTVKLADRDADDADAARWISRTLPRGLVFLAQTPQAFRRNVLVDAVRLGQSGVEATDEASLAEQAGHRVRVVEGSARNIKVTSGEDLAVARSLDAQGGTPDAGLTAGIGYDIHRLVEGRRLILGGVEIPFERGALGHSDADVLCHAITDAILGAAGAGDIGRHFPDTDERWRGASSIDLLRRAAGLLRDRGWAVVNVDAVLIAERPKVSAHLTDITANLARALDVPRGSVSVKGKTNEGLGEIGRGEAIACQAIALLRRTVNS